MFLPHHLLQLAKLNSQGWSYCSGTLEDKRIYNPFGIRYVCYLYCYYYIYYYYILLLYIIILEDYLYHMKALNDTDVWIEISKRGKFAAKSLLKLVLLVCCFYFIKETPNEFFLCLCVCVCVCVCVCMCVCVCVCVCKLWSQHSKCCLTFRKPKNTYLAVHVFVCTFPVLWHQACLNHSVHAQISIWHIFVMEQQAFYYVQSDWTSLVLSQSPKMLVTYSLFLCSTMKSVMVWFLSLTQLMKKGWDCLVKCSVSVQSLELLVTH